MKAWSVDELRVLVICRIPSLGWRLVSAGHNGNASWRGARSAMVRRRPRIGHADVGVTIKVYAHVLPGDDEDAALRADSLLAT